jgi:DNA-directed RNA polymerase specialized sigma24 family protein
MRAKSALHRALERIRLLPRPDRTVENEVAERTQLRKTIAAVAELRPRDQELVALRVAGGLSFAEIGDIVGISADAAKMATRRAISQVRAIADGSSPGAQP